MHKKMRLKKLNPIKVSIRDQVGKGDLNWVPTSSFCLFLSSSKSSASSSPMHLIVCMFICMLRYLSHVKISLKNYGFLNFYFSVSFPLCFPAIILVHRSKWILSLRYRLFPLAIKTNSFVQRDVFTSFLLFLVLILQPFLSCFISFTWISAHPEILLVYFVVQDIVIC